MPTFCGLPNANPPPPRAASQCGCLDRHPEFFMIFFFLPFLYRQSVNFVFFSHIVRARWPPSPVGPAFVRRLLAATHTHSPSAAPERWLRALGKGCRLRPSSARLETLPMD